MPGDGNCLFSSLSDQLHHDGGKNHLEVRHAVCNYIETFPGEFKDWLCDEQIANINAYVQNLRRWGTWGGDVEVNAASKVFR